MIMYYVIQEIKYHAGHKLEVSTRRDASKDIGELRLKGWLKFIGMWIVR